MKETPEREGESMTEQPHRGPFALYAARSMVILTGLSFGLMVCGPMLQSFSTKGCIWVVRPWVLNWTLLTSAVGWVVVVAMIGFAGKRKHRKLLVASIALSILGPFAILFRLLVLVPCFMLPWSAVATAAPHDIRGTPYVFWMPLAAERRLIVASGASPWGQERPIRSEPSQRAIESLSRPLRGLIPFCGA